MSYLSNLSGGWSTMSSIPGLPSPKLFGGKSRSKSQLRGGKMNGSDAAAIVCFLLLVFLLITLTLGCCYCDWSPLLGQVVLITGGGGAAGAAGAERVYHDAATASAATSAAAGSANTSAQKYLEFSQGATLIQSDYMNSLNNTTPVDFKNALSSIEAANIQAQSGRENGSDAIQQTQKAAEIVPLAFGKNALDVSKAALTASVQAKTGLDATATLIETARGLIALAKTARKPIDDPDAPASDAPDVPTPDPDTGKAEVLAAGVAVDAAIASLLETSASVNAAVQAAWAAAGNAAQGAAAGKDSLIKWGCDDPAPAPAPALTQANGASNGQMQAAANRNPRALASGRMPNTSASAPAARRPHSPSGAAPLRAPSSQNRVANLPNEEVARGMLASATPAMLFIFSDGCGFCIKAKPVFDKLATTFPAVNFGALNSKNAAGLISENNITGFPTFLTNFGPVRKHVGYKAHDVMATIVESARPAKAMAMAGRGGPGHPSIPHAQNRGGYGNRIVVSPMIASSQHAMRAGPVSPIPAAAGISGSMEVDEATAIQALADSSIPAIVFLYANWCGHCQKMKPVFQEAFKEGKFRNVKMMTLNGEKAQQLTTQNNISGFPTFLTNFGDKKYVGFRNRDMLHDILKKA